MDWGEGERKDNSWDLCFQVLKESFFISLMINRKVVCTNKREGEKSDVNENTGIHWHSKTKL